MFARNPIWILALCIVSCGIDRRAPQDAWLPDDPRLLGVQDIFNRHCLSTCHVPPEPDAKLSLEGDVAHDNLVNIGTEAYCGSSGIRVIPGDPDGSCLWQLDDEDTMPLERPPLSAFQKQMIHDWIAGGAPP
jgi:hypothetical protein